MYLYSFSKKSRVLSEIGSNGQLQKFIDS